MFRRLSLTKAGRASRRKRILFIEFNTDGTVGGSHTCLLDTIEHLDREKFDPFVLFYQDNPLVSKFSEVATTFVAPPPVPARSPEGTRHLPPLVASAVNFLRKAVNGTRLLALPVIDHARLLRRHRIDLVHLNNGLQVGLDWLIAAKLARARCVAHQRGDGPATRLQRGRHFDKIICMSLQLRDELIRQDPTLDRSAITIYDGVDVDQFKAGLDEGSSRSIRHELGIPADAFLIGMVGNIKEWKGQHVVARAFALLNGKAPNARLMFVGSGSTVPEDQSYYRDLQRFISDAGLEQRVLFTGFRKDVPHLVNALDVLVHASVHPEPFGRVILEGMALGKPVIATDHGGPREIIENGRNGFLVPPNDPESLARCIQALIDAPALCREIGRQAVKRVVTKFSTPQATLEFERLYSSLLAVSPAQGARAFVCNLSGTPLA